MMTSTSPARTGGRLAMLQLASPLLPVGAYAYSQGLERAVHDGHVIDAATAQRWIVDLVRGPVAHFDAPVFLRLHGAAVARDAASFTRWNGRVIASRETRELRAESVQMGASLATLARELGLRQASALLDGLDRVAFPAAFAACAVALGVDVDDASIACLYGWLENQVAALLKVAPLGQATGQRLLLAAQQPLAEAIAIAATLADDELASSAPGLALSSALHETQYSRLFRS
jgi:urease accessory protein